ncbi:hypothetical protein ABW19_dt0201173 [Dactylella cylindrospora]|nr:hypothetical protein ABW19_dt0201173 [Dactylella cylindrospora]
MRKDRPAPIGVPGRTLADSRGKTSSPLNTFTPPISRALDATQTDGDSGDRKRRLDEDGNGVPSKKSKFEERFEGMTKEQRAAEIKRLKALKAAKEARKANGSTTKDGTGSGSAPSNPNSPVTAEAPRKPAKGSYAEIMERAKQIQATAAQPTKIIHKDHKAEKKKLGKPDKPEPSKKPVATSSKPLGGKVGAHSSSKESPARKTVGRAPDTKKPEPAKPAPSKPRVPVVEYKGTARPSATSKASSSKVSSSRPADRERERDRDRDRDRDRSRSWERERERVRYRSPVKKYASHVRAQYVDLLLTVLIIRYRYVEDDEDDYYSDSDDMEATGFDILEEEEFSRKTAVREDIEAERLERELAMKKAAKKKQVVGRR